MLAWLEAKVDALEKELRKKNFDEDMNPIFFAKKEKIPPAHHAPMNPKIRLGRAIRNNMYNEVVMNTGNGLDIKSGEFKAPFRGYYYFHASSLGQPGQKAELRHNKKAVVSRTVPSGKHNSDTWFPKELQATLLLNTGDKVSVHFRANEGTWISLNGHGVTFTGFLLRRSLPFPPIPISYGPEPVNTLPLIIRDVPEPIDPILPELVDPIKPEPLPISIEPVDVTKVPVIAIAKETFPEPIAPAPSVEENA